MYKYRNLINGDVKVGKSPFKKRQLLIFHFSPLISNVLLFDTAVLSRLAEPNAPFKDVTDERLKTRTSMLMMGGAVAA